MSPGGGDSGASPGGDKNTAFPPPSRRQNTFLEFVAPGKVEVRREDIPEGEAVGEGQVLVEAVCSSISSGTELKVIDSRGGRVELWVGLKGELRGGSTCGNVGMLCGLREGLLPPRGCVSCVVGWVIVTASMFLVLLDILCSRLRI